MKIISIILAAGQSKRMGRDKLSLPIRGGTIAGSVLSSSLQSNVDHTIVVTNPTNHCLWAPQEYSHSDWSHKWSIVVCPEAWKGQSYSVKCGMEATKQLAADAVLILLADQPHITKSYLNHMISRYKQSKDLLFVASRLNGIPQPPILFSKQLFPQFHKLKGDRGAGQLIRANPLATKGTYLEVAYLKDIDTPSDYRQYIAKKGS
ncbi:nucleotidyltransferase family protein [Alkalihalobacillus sp. FSL W8-0930]